MLELCSDGGFCSHAAASPEAAAPPSVAPLAGANDGNNNLQTFINNNLGNGNDFPSASSSSHTTYDHKISFGLHHDRISHYVHPSLGSPPQSSDMKSEKGVDNFKRQTPSPTRSYDESTSINVHSVQPNNTSQPNLRSEPQSLNTVNTNAKSQLLHTPEEIMNFHGGNQSPLQHDYPPYNTVHNDLSHLTLLQPTSIGSTVNFLHHHSSAEYITQAQMETLSYPSTTNFQGG